MSSTTPRTADHGEQGPADRLRQASNNDWLVTNQFTVVEGHVNRRPDVVVFVNGLPLRSSS